MNEKQNRTAANRPPATHELECHECGGSFLGDEHHRFCGVCIVEVAREIAEIQREARNPIGLSKGPIEGCRPISTTKPGTEKASHAKAARAILALVEMFAGRRHAGGLTHGAGAVDMTDALGKCSWVFVRRSR